MPTNLFQAARSWLFPSALFLSTDCDSESPPIWMSGEVIRPPRTTVPLVISLVVFQAFFSKPAQSIQPQDSRDSLALRQRNRCKRASRDVGFENGRKVIW